MTDKEIIIDGVDVSKCSRLIVNKLYGYVCNCEEDEHLISSCKNRPNCYFKQLSRKTTECEEMKKGYAELTKIVSPYMDDFTGYNEELGGFDPILCVKELQEQLARKTQECEQKEKRNAALFLMSNRYRKALEEIEKYTRKQFCDNCEDISSTEYNCHCEYCEYQEYFDIIAKAKDGK